MIKPRTNLKKVIQKVKNQNREYHQLILNARKDGERKQNIYDYSIRLLVENVKEKQVLKNKPPVEIIKEIEKTIIKRVPYPVLKKEEIIKEVEVEVIKKVPQEIIKYIPFEVEVEVDNPETINMYKKTISDIKEDSTTKIKELNEDFNTKLEKMNEDFNTKFRVSMEAAGDRYGAAIKLIKAQKELQLKELGLVQEFLNKRHRRWATLIYILTLYTLPQILTWIIL